jgi:hypothetical protein
MRMSEGVDVKVCPKEGGPISEHQNVIDFDHACFLSVVRKHTVALSGRAPGVAQVGFGQTKERYQFNFAFAPDKH